VKVEELTVREASKRIAELDVVDVREEDEFHGPLGHIAGARLLPYDHLEQAADQLPRHRLLLIACRTGRRSRMACELLAALGITSTINLSGGMMAWNDAELPVVRRATEESA